MKGYLARHSRNIPCSVQINPRQRVQPSNFGSLDNGSTFSRGVNVLCVRTQVYLITPIDSDGMLHLHVCCSLLNEFALSQSSKYEGVISCTTVGNIVHCNIFWMEYARSG